MDTLIQDLKYGLRQLARNPGFTAVVLLTLALGIGANTAIFSVVNAVLLRPLPYQDPGRLMMVWLDNRVEGWPEDLTSYPNFLDWGDQNQVFESMAAYAPTLVSLTGGGEPERLRAVVTSASLFEVLRVQPAQGRVFRPEEERPQAERVVLLSDGLWRRRFGADPAVIGKSLSLNDQPATVVGILPSDFRFPPDTELWISFSLYPRQRMESRGSLWLRVIGRLKPEVSYEQAQAGMSRVARRLAQQFPDSNANYGINLNPLHRQVVGKVRPVLLVLLAAVGFVLLIACANVANLLLARAAGREKEIAIRAALGAARRRLVRQLLTESLLLALLGAALGVLLASWGLDLLRALQPANLPRLEEIALDVPVLAFTLVLTVLTGLLFGLVPALRTSRSDLNESLKEGGRTSTAVSHARIRSFLVVSEVALALLLLVGAGLTARSFLRLLEVDPGFNPERLLSFDLSLPSTRYTQDSKAIQFYQQLFDRLQSLPGVMAVGATSDVPLSGRQWPNAASFTLEGRAPHPGEETLSVNITAVTPDFFRAAGVPLLKGRFCTGQDTPDAPPVLLINEAFVRRFFIDQDPIGKRMKYGDATSSDPWKTIVGVVGDIRDLELERQPRIASYLCHAQDPYRSMTVLVHTAGDPLRLTETLRQEVWGLDNELPVSNIITMEQRLARSAAPRRFNMLLLGLFAALALVLSAVGVYGVMSYSVNQRTHEIGLRMALGAHPADILRLVLRQGMGLVLVGMSIGLAGALAVSRLLSSLLYGISATDPLTFVAVALLLLAVALLACLLPARRATRVDPLVALRYE